MRTSQIKNFLEHGREIEFYYNGKHYSFTFDKNSKGKNIIAFCEFNKDDIECENIDELLSSKYDGLLISDIINDLSEEELDVY